MKLRHLSFLLALFPSFLSSCNKSNENPNYYLINTKEEEKVTADIMFLSHTGNNIYESFTYSDKYFDNQKKDKLNLSLARAGLGVALVPSYPKEDVPALTKFGFTNLEDGLTSDTLGEYDRAYYIFAHKKIGDRDLVLATIRGSDYKEEWVSNFNLGASGDHNGFSIPANRIVTLLKEYITKYDLQDDPKIWVTGYSRGGAIANILGKLIYNDSFFKVEEGDGDLYVYTYEAPKGSLQDNKNYPFIHNIANKDDFFAHNFGLDFVRLGKTHIINDYIDPKIAEEFCQNLEKDNPLPTFFPKKFNFAGPEYIVNDYDSSLTSSDFIKQLMKVVYLDTSGLSDPDKYLSFNTREDYMNNGYYAYSSIVLRLLTLTKENMDGIANHFAEVGYAKLIATVTKLTSSSATPEDYYAFLSEVFDAGNITYTEAELTLLSEQICPITKSIVAICGGLFDALNFIANLVGNSNYLYLNHRNTLIYSYLHAMN